jgi:hypothetical protein
MPLTRLEFCSDNTDQLHMLIKPFRRAALGPDGLSDVGDRADISLLHELSGEDAHDSLRYAPVCVYVPTA